MTAVSTARCTAALLAGTLALGAAACATTLARVQQHGDGRVVLTGGSNHSMVYVAPLDAGVLIIDLGWAREEDRLWHALAELGADTSDVVAVLLTHAHRDHMGQWELVKGAPFWMAEAEVPLFTGQVDPGGWLAGLGADVVPAHRPAPGVVDVHTFSRDTTLVFGRDTVHTFLVPGHTPGSTAYLFRGILFTGDAAVGRPFGGYRASFGAYSGDVEQARASLASLWRRAAAYRVDWICTAHGQCSEGPRRALPPAQAYRDHMRPYGLLVEIQ